MMRGQDEGCTGASSHYIKDNVCLRLVQPRQRSCSRKTLLSEFKATRQAHAVLTAGCLVQARHSPLHASPSSLVFQALM